MRVLFVGGGGSKCTFRRFLRNFADLQLRIIAFHRPGVTRHMTHEVVATQWNYLCVR